VFEGPVEFFCSLLACTKELNLCVSPESSSFDHDHLMKNSLFFLSDNSDFQHRQSGHLNRKMVLFLLLTCVPRVSFISLPALARNVQCNAEKEWTGGRPHLLPYLLGNFSFIMIKYEVNTRLLCI
jgi:hypothetical protein